MVLSILPPTVIYFQSQNSKSCDMPQASLFLISSDFIKPFKKKNPTIPNIKIL